MPCKRCGASVGVPLDLTVNQLTCGGCGTAQPVNAYISDGERFAMDMQRQVAGNDALKALKASGVPCTKCGGLNPFPPDGQIQTVCKLSLIHISSEHSNVASRVSPPASLRIREIPPPAPKEAQLPAPPKVHARCSAPSVGGASIGVGVSVGSGVSRAAGASMTPPASTSEHAHTPNPVPSALHTCPPAHPPAPTQPTDIPGVHADGDGLHPDPRTSAAPTIKHQSSRFMSGW